MLAMRHKKAITADTRKRYAKATKKEKTIILDQLIAITGYNRTYAARIKHRCMYLRQLGKHQLDFHLK